MVCVKKMSKTPRDISFNTSVTEIMTICFTCYCSWDMANDRCNCYFSFWAILFPFTPLRTAQKNENFKKMKKKNPWRYDHLTQMYQKSWSYVLLFLRYSVWQMELLFFILGYFLPFYNPNSTNNENFKKWKT